MTSSVESTDLDSGWANAIGENYGIEVKTTVDPSKQAEPKEPEEEEKTPAVVVEDPAPKDPGTPEVKDPEADLEKKDPVEADPAVAPAAVPAETPEADPALTPKEAVKEALRELGQEQAAVETTRKAIKAEVLDTLYPEGLNRQLLDSDGEPITGIDDLVKLVNPSTNQYFTEEEAGSWLLASQKELNKTIEQIEQYVDGVAETHVTLKESAEYIEHKWGEVMKSFPDVAEKVLQSFNKTLVKDKKTNIVIKAPVDMAEYYDIALSGYAKMAEQMALSKEAETKAAADEAAAKAKVAQEERGDVGVGGDSKLPLPKEKQDWAKAYKEYYEV